MAIDMKLVGKRIVLSRKGLVVIGVQGYLEGYLESYLEDVGRRYSGKTSWKVGAVDNSHSSYEILPMFKSRPPMNLDITRVNGGNCFAVAEGLNEDMLGKAIDEFENITGFMSGVPREDFIDTVLCTLSVRAGLYGVACGRAENGEATIENAYGGINFFTFLGLNGKNREEAGRITFEEFGVRF
jgi:hypothetical protein